VVSEGEFTMADKQRSDKQRSGADRDKTGRTETGSFRTVDGIQLQTERHTPALPRGQVLVIHGYAEHMGRYGELVALVNDAGYTCRLLDLRGHGRATGPRGFVEDFEDYLEDLDAFLGDGRGASPNILLGHSLGGLISLLYLLRRPESFDGLVLSSPFFAAAGKVPVWKSLLGTVAAKVAPKLGVKGALDPGGLTRDLEKVRQYREDPLVFDEVNTRWYAEVQEAQEEALKRAGEITVPALVLGGEKDPVAAPARTREVFEKLSSEDKELHFYPGMLHEVFNEVGRGEVYQDLSRWLRQRASASGDPPAAQ